MAHRTGRGMMELSLSGMPPPCRRALSVEAKEGQAVPACARDLTGDGAQRAIAPPLVLEPFGQYSYRDRHSAEVAAQDRARGRDAPVVGGPSAGSSALFEKRKSIVQALRRPNAQIGFVRDFGGASKRPFRESALGQCLQAPGDAPKQLFPVFRARLLAEQLAVPFPQPADAGLV